MSDSGKPSSFSDQPPAVCRAISEEEFASRREEMVEKQLRARDVRDPRVLLVMGSVPRHAFVLREFLEQAYEDRALPIAEGQTISQPVMVAAMSEALELSGNERVLEIGTGSGYQTAVLARLAREVFSVEARDSLADVARARLERLRYGNVQIRVGDGSLGWPEQGPFDAILVTAAAPGVPPPLIEQLAEGGRLVLPSGSAESQHILRIRRKAGNILTERLMGCRFVPLIGHFGWSVEQT